jgi:hypothetical protein
VSLSVLSDGKLIYPLDEKSQSLLNAVSAQGMRDRVINFIVSTGVPLRIVEHSSFNEILVYALAEKAMRVPVPRSAKTVRQDITNRFDKVQEQVGEVLRQSHGLINFTSDGWTDKRNRSYYALTAHFFYNERLCCLLLGMLHKPGVVVEPSPKDIEASAFRLQRSTGDNIHRVLDDIWRRYGLSDDRKGCIVTDRGANMVVAARQFVADGHARACFQHAVQCFVKAVWQALDGVSAALQHARTITGLVKKSGVFKSLAVAHNVGRLRMGCPTRWTTMIQCGMDVFRACNELKRLSQCGEDVPESFTEAWDQLIANGERGLFLLRDLALLLGGLDGLTIELEGEYEITISRVLPRLIDEQRKLSECFDLARAAAARGQQFGVHKQLSCPVVGGDYIQTGGTRLRVSNLLAWERTVLAQFSRYLRPFLKDEMMLAATLLDRRTDLSALSPTVMSDASAALKGLLLKQYNQMNQGPQRQDQGPQRQALGDQSDDLVDYLGVASAPVAIADPMVAVNAEYQQLLRLRQLAANADPLAALQHLPTAHRLARWLLSIPAGEAPSERIFSIAGRMFGKLRQAMKPELLEKLTFCQKNAIALRRSAGLK